MLKEEYVASQEAIGMNLCGVKTSFSSKAFSLLQRGLARIGTITPKFSRPRLDFFAYQYTVCTHIHTPLGSLL